MGNRDHHDIHHRRTIRLQEYDYRSAGGYFVTICSADRRLIFGNLLDGQVYLSSLGTIVQEEWHRTAEVRPNVVLDGFTIMPNHVHGIIILMDNRNLTDNRSLTDKAKPTDNTHVVGASRWLAWGGVERPTGDHQRAGPGSLSAIIAQFKSMVSKRDKAVGAEGTVWQRGYYDHVIRGEDELNHIREYIINNPTRWEEDEYHVG